MSAIIAIEQWKRSEVFMAQTYSYAKYKSH